MKTIALTPTPPLAMDVMPDHHAGQDLPQIPPKVLGRIAAEAAGAAERIAALLESAAAPRRLAQAHAQARELAALCIQAQRCARVLEGNTLPAREYVALDVALLQALAALPPECGATALELHAALVWMEPAVVALLFELALDWARRAGRRIDARVTFGGEPPHPDLVITVYRAAPARAAGPAADGAGQAHWLLLELLARSQMLDTQRLADAGSTTLVIRFPVTAPAAGGLAAPPQHMAPGSAAGGCHVVIVERDDNLRLLMRQLLHDAGMVVEGFASPRQAEDLSGHFVAEALVSGYEPGDPQMMALVGVLRQKNPAVRVIQLSDEDFLYIGQDGATEAARVGRASVKQALVHAVALSVGLFAPPTLAARAHA